jgi:hypothetical protein
MAILDGMSIYRGLHAWARMRREMLGVAAIHYGPGLGPGAKRVVAA